MNRAAKAKRAATGQWRVLVVDDEEDLREELGDFLRGNGMEVETVADQDQARASLKRKRFDVILLDLWLMQGSGLELLWDLGRANDTPCIIMTAQDDIAEKTIGLRKAASDYILKPLQPRELLARISAVCHDRTILPNILRDRRGSVSIMVALSLAMLVAIAAIVIDTGALYYARRAMQATTDAAALAAVQNPTNAAAIAASVFAANGYSGQTLTVTPGLYTADETLAAQNRFVAGSANINAVRVGATLQQPAFFSVYFGLGPKMTLATQATAARVATASFGAGTSLARLNAGLINTVLTQLWGSNVNLSLIDYRALTLTNIQALPLLNQLATNIGITGSYQQLAQSSITVGQFLTALIQTAQAEGLPATAILPLQSLYNQSHNSTQVTLGSILDLTPLYGRTIGAVLTTANPNLQLNLMNMVSASARALSNGKLIDLGTAISVPVLGSQITAKLVVGSPMAEAAIAKPGTTLQTSQVRLALNAKVIGINLAGILSTTVQVATVLQAAYGQATLISLPCTAAGDRAKIAASSGLASVQFGSVTDSQLQNLSAPLVLTATPVIAVSILTIPVNIGISGSATIGANGPTTLTFTQSDITNGTVKSVSSGTLTPFNTIAANFSLFSDVAGNPLLSATVNLLLGSLQPLVASLLSPLDASVDQILASLGLTLGNLDVRVFDTSCRTPTLVG